MLLWAKPKKVEKLLNKLIVQLCFLRKPQKTQKAGSREWFIKMNDNQLKLLLLFYQI